MFWGNEKTKEKIDTELSLYEKRRKLEIDEQLSEWRRSQKNRAVEEVLSETEAVRQNAQKFFMKFHEDEVSFRVEFAEKNKTLSLLDAEIDKKKGLSAQVQTDFEARGLLRDRAAKAEKEKADAVGAEKDAMITLLKAENTDLRTNYNTLLGKAVESLGKAADKEAVTKVVGFGPSSEPRKV